MELLFGNVVCVCVFVWHLDISLVTVKHKLEMRNINLRSDSVLILCVLATKMHNAAN